MTTTTVASITVIGRRWFDRVNGNTYFSSEILVNGERVDGEEYAYGYGDYYVQDAADRLERGGYMPGRERYPHGSGEPLWQYCRDRDIAFTYHVSDVARKRDL